MISENKFDTPSRFDVGGVALERPFKVRRLGHVGYNGIRMDECLRFYVDDVGLRVADVLDFSVEAEHAGNLADVGDTRGYFLRFGSEHHSFVLFNQRLRERVGRQRPGVTINQISWTVGSLEEVVNGAHWLAGNGVPPARSGRDMPGSNFHTYFPDLDGHTNELLYGIEQIGWDNKSKPQALHYLRLRELAKLPHIPENEELVIARERGIDLASGSANEDPLPNLFDVEGVMLPRPFKITKMGPVYLFVEDVAAAASFYERIIGLRLTEHVVWEGHATAFLRANTEHHTIGLFPRALRTRLGLREDTSAMSIGFRVGSYRQLVAAREFFQSRGALFADIPIALHPGVDYAFYVNDPDGHLLMFYFAMEQIGWEGKPRPAHARTRVTEPWPVMLLDGPELYDGEIFTGPLG